MVHGELIAQGKVEKLTYRQLRALEKIDAKKARDAKLLELADSAIKASGQSLEGLFQGVGRGFEGYFSGDALAFLAKSAVGLVFLQWLIQYYPNFAKSTHLDALAIRLPNSSGVAPITSNPTVPGPTSTSPDAKYCFRLRSDGSVYCWTDPSQRDGAALLVEGTGQGVDIFNK